MVGNRLLIHSIFLVILPVIVAYYGISTAGAIALMVFALAWRLAITLSVFLYPPKVPKLELETISLSHFAEKVRWSMDRLGVDYVERQMAGIIGVFFTGRTVPQLKIRTGLVRSVIGDSPDILRYLWGKYSSESPEKTAFLEPTPERLELEHRIGRYGRDLQVWIYSHILSDRSLCLDAWGRSCPQIPLWQRWLLITCHPVLTAFMRKAFGLSEQGYSGAVQRIEVFLEEMEAQLGDGRRSVLSGNEIDFADISLASISSLWLQPAEFAAGKSDAARIEPDRFPEKMHTDIGRWKNSYPHTTDFIQRLYKEERIQGPA